MARTMAPASVGRMCIPHVYSFQHKNKITLLEHNFPTVGWLSGKACLVAPGCTKCLDERALQKAQSRTWLAELTLLRHPIHPPTTESAPPASSQFQPPPPDLKTFLRLWTDVIGDVNKHLGDAVDPSLPLDVLKCPARSP